jgi:DNA-binding transcriptional LysR family regulator
MLAACSHSFPIESGDIKEIAALAQHPLLVLDPTYATRNVFDAACHLADFKPNILFEGRSVNTLLAMAEAGHGIAIIPSVLKVDPSKVRTILITHRRESLQLTVAVIWDKRRMPSRYADQFADLLAAHIRESYPPVHIPAVPAPRHPPRRSARRAHRAGVASSPALP